MGAVRYTEAPARRDRLLRHLDRDGYVSSARLAAELGVSEMTIRRDLRRLHDEGLAQRVTGGASRAVPFDERRTQGAEAKHAIARTCATLLQGCRTVALDAGTTVAPLVPLLAAGTTVVSHSVPVISACSERADLDLIGVGGEYRRDTRSFAGPAARAAIAELSVQVAVLSATAVADSGVFSASASDAELKRALIGVAERVILVADHSKLGLRAPIRVCGVDAVGTVVTDGGAPADRLEQLRETGVTVIVAGEGDAL